MPYCAIACGAEPPDDDEEPGHENGTDYDNRIDECRDYLESVYKNS